MSIIGLNEAIIVSAVAVTLLFGPKKLPGLARSLGESKKAFKTSMQEAETVDENMDDLTT